MKKTDGEKENHKKRIIIEKLGGVKAFDEFTLDKFERARAPRIYAAAAAFDPDRHNFYFWGAPRSGKTFLSVAIARQFHPETDHVQIVALPSLTTNVKIFETQYNYDGKKKFLDRLIKARILVLHELGRGVLSGWQGDFANEILWSILEGRLLAGQNGLICTGNFSLDDIAKKHGATISERLKELCGANGIFRFAPRPGLTVI